MYFTETTIVFPLVRPKEAPGWQTEESELSQHNTPSEPAFPFKVYLKLLLLAQELNPKKPV